MALLMLHILMAVLTAIFGISKGYNGVFCGEIGFFGGILALPIIAVLPDKNEEQAQAAARRHYDAEVDALRRRVEELEAALNVGSETPAENAGTEAVEAEATEKELRQEGDPAHFAARTQDVIACPRCGKRQIGNRDLCYSCGLPFVYDKDETT